MSYKNVGFEMPFLQRWIWRLFGKRYCGFHLGTWVIGYQFRGVMLVWKIETAPETLFGIPSMTLSEAQQTSRELSKRLSSARDRSQE